MKTSEITVSDFMHSNITGVVGKVGLQMHDSMPSCNEPSSRRKSYETVKQRNQAILDPKHDAKETSTEFIYDFLAKMGVKPHVERPSGNDPERMNNWNNDLKHRNQVILVPIEDEDKPLKTSRKVSVGSRANKKVQLHDSRPSYNEPQSTKLKRLKP